MFRPPKISVIIPVYNTEKYLRECLDSVINQTLGDIEIICVDDGSTDSSLDILREYEEEDSRVLVITQTNATAGAARNNGMEHSHGKYLLFLDADDYLKPDTLKTVYAIANNNNADVTIFGGKIFNALTGKAHIAAHYVKYQLMPSVQPFSALDCASNIFQITHPGPFNKLFKASFIREHSLTFQALPNTNDLFFVCSALSEAERICYCKDQFYYHRAGTGASIQDHKSKNPKCFFYAMNALKARLAERGKYDTFYESFAKFAKSCCDFNFKSFSYDVLSEEERKEILDAAILPKPASRPLVSVIIPVYNAENDLKACLDSVVAQTLKDIEIICVNDGSTDGSAKILSQYEKQDLRIRIIRNDTSKGLLYARKVGAMAAKGNYITFVEAVDSLFPDACEEMLDAAERYALDIAQFGAEVVNCTDVQGATDWRAKAMQPKDMAVSGEELMRSFFVKRENVTNVWAKLYKRELCQTAFSKIPDGYCYVGENTFFFFFVCLYGTQYKGFPEIKAYRYNYELGISNTGAVSLDKFEMDCKMSDCVRYTLEYLQSHAPNAANEAGANAMGTRMLTDCCRMFASCVSEKDKETAAKLLKSNWEAFAFTEKVIEDTFHMGSAQLWDTYFNIPCYYKEAPAYLAGNQPKVSVIIPAYNVELYLRECIDSIINQSLKDIEIICVNDGSLDGSLAIIEEYAQRDDRIAVFSQRNGGPSSARNRGLEAAHGKYIYFFDGDDLLAESALEELYETAEEDKLDILLFGADVFFESEEMMKDHANYIGYYDREDIPDVLSGSELLSIYQKQGGFLAHAALQFFNAQFLVNSKVKFLEGILHEDELFSAILLPKARRLRVSTAKYYLRRMRGNSIMTTKVNHKHVEGIFIVAINILAEAGSYKGDAGTYRFLRNYGKRKLDATKRKYKQLSKEEREKVFADAEKYKTLFSCYKLLFLRDLREPKKSNNSASGKTGGSGANEAARIRASASYKIGRSITFIPRKIRGGVKCYKQHGLRYTAHRLLVHLHIKKK